MSTMFPKSDAYDPTGANILVGKHKIKMSELELPGELDGIEVWKILAVGPAVEATDDPRFCFKPGDFVLMSGGTRMTPILVEGYAFRDAGVCSVAAITCRIDPEKVRIKPMSDDSPNILLPNKKGVTLC